MTVIEPRDRFANFVATLTPPGAGIFDEPLLCVSVNAEWWSFLSGALTSLLQVNLWGEEAIQNVLEIMVSVGICMPALPSAFGGVLDGDSVTIETSQKVISLDVLLDGELTLNGELFLL
jgi:hypothetical protein